MPGEVAVLFVEVADRTFAVEMGQVETLRRRETLYPVQEGPPGLVGFLPMGGSAVPVVDLAGHLGLSRGAVATGRLLLVSALEEACLAFQVQRVAGPLTVPYADIALLPELLRELQGRQVVWGLVRRGEELVPLLDLGRVLAQDEVAALLELAAAVVSRG